MSAFLPSPLAAYDMQNAFLARDAMMLEKNTLSEKMLYLSPRQVLERQLSILGGIRLPTIICALDCPISKIHADWRERDQCIVQTIAFASELKYLLEQYHLGSFIRPMAIVQGNDLSSLCYCAQELAALRFPFYGIGSLAPLKQHALIMARVEAVASIVGADRLHVFGVSVIETVKALRAIGVHSIDSARPAKAAAFNEVFYSSPYRRYGILSSTGENEPLKGRIPRTRRLSVPLPCHCPICRSDPQRILGIGKRSLIRDRSIHNYYHLKQIFCKEER
jgi:tRNA-guanine family transglycosylase